MPHDPYRGVWVFTEQSGGTLERVGLELLGKARELATELKVEVAAVVLGHNIQGVGDELIAHGADTVYIADDKELEHYRCLPYRRVICDIVREYKPEILIMGATTVGRELAPRVAARLATGITADATELVVGPYKDRRTKTEFQEIFQPIRPSFEESVLATIVGPEHFPQMASVRPGVFPKPEADRSRKGKVVPCTPKFEESDLLVEILEIKKVEEKLDLTGMKRIVSIGMGAKDDPQKGFALAQDLVDLLPGPAEVGASRDAVEAGFIDRGHQVGQTGQTVRPDLYLAAGISGAIQHIFGMKHSKTIVAVNTDEKAPIFGVADYGLVGDLHEILPLIAQRVKELRGKNKAAPVQP